ncbi:FAD-binding domain-containing protein [Massarina eburnea CBS 473.64]|uniref:FAD-binding domain-containing protein n=1 Tax=Massarina eburnea CBS 473.64 TaxID=1395130 RepID=A0A6A6S8R0_9PLEO|nr:FAD-binding domain-containing protein [Massarina eburnea CBS 473.64]
MAIFANLAVSTSLLLLSLITFWGNPIYAIAVDIRAAPDLRAILTNTANNKWSKETVLLFPSTPGFEEATERWTVFRPPTYSAAIQPGTVADIQNVVKLAKKYQVPFLTRGAGHGYSTSLALFQNGLALDLSQFKSIQINKNAQTVTIGPGVTTRDLLDPLYKAGYEIPTGTCQCPSLIGVTLGGGVGRFQGIHGLVLDSLLSVRVVTAKGDVVEASKSTNPDLFWGIRGAGTNFGVITSATYKIYPLTNQGDFTYGAFAFLGNGTNAYFDALASFKNGMPEKLSSFSYIIYNETLSQTIVVSNWVYLGPEAEGLKAIEPITKLNPPTSVIARVPYNELISTTVGGNFDVLDCVRNLTLANYNLNQNTYNATLYKSTFEKMTKWFDENPNGRSSSIVFENLPNQAVAAVPSGDTAFSYRNSKGYVIPTFLWALGDTATEKAANRIGLEIRDDFAAGADNKAREVFANYARGDETLEQIYGKDKLPRLAAVKRAWDPSNIFAFNHPLPTSYP